MAVMLSVILSTIPSGQVYAEMPVPGQDASLEEDDQAAIEDAQRALANADFDALIPLLYDIVEKEHAPAGAHILYALGLLFEAQDESGPADEMRTRAEVHIEHALRIEPQLQLDPYLYPAEFLRRVEEIQSRRHREGESADGKELVSIDSDGHFYFERYVETRSRWPLFLPFGAGQFYKGEPFGGITFATVQTAGLGLNIVGYWVVEGLRGESGQIPTSDFDTARRWRRAQIGGLLLFFGGWILGAVEANWDFEPHSVRIRTLDGPPEELEPSFSDVGFEHSLQLQWSLRF